MCCFREIFGVSSNLRRAESGSAIAVATQAMITKLGLNHVADSVVGTILNLGERRRTLVDHNHGDWN
jgi:hypothetical protein